MPVRVLVADDQAMVRGGFSMIIDAEPDMEMVGEADDGERAVRETARLHPDVVVMDIQMPNLDGVSATREILARVDPAPRILVVTTFDIDEYVYEALRAGASGFLLKNSPPEELVRAIRVLAAGDALLSPSVTRRLLEEFSRRPVASGHTPKSLEDLTNREIEVLTLVARGLSNAEIAERLVVTTGTVKTHVARVLMKLDLRDRLQAAVLAYETGLIKPGASEPERGR
jgi:DNA-binding NarL/FixJ family response regulator